jgi:hypothetical protein
VLVVALPHVDGMPAQPSTDVQQTCCSIHHLSSASSLFWISWVGTCVDLYRLQHPHHGRHSPSLPPLPHSPFLPSR